MPRRRWSILLGSKESEKEFKKEKEQIIQLLKQKQIKIDEIYIKKEETGRYTVTIYQKKCDDADGSNCECKTIGQIISRVLNEKLTLTNQDCGLRTKKDICKFTYMSKDKFNLQIGVAGTLPPGWRTTQGGNEVHSYPNSYGSGARVMSGFSGWQGKALYWREVSADYGRQSSYPLTLKPGLYKLTYVMAAWKGSPNYKARILTSGGSVVATSASQNANPNANGNTGASIASSPVRELIFQINTEGKYIIEFRNAGSGFEEFLLAECRVNLTEDPSGVIPVAAGECEPEAIYSVSGQETETLRQGINIIRMSDGTAGKVFVP